MEFPSAFLKDIRYTLLAALLVTLIYNFASGAASLDFILPILVTVAFAAVLELVIWHFEKRPLEIPLSAIVSSTIISIVLTPLFSTIHFSFLAVAIALLSKHFIKMGFAHVFNPANFGILIVSLLQPLLQSWWATSNPILTAILGAIVVYRIKGWRITIPFLLITLALTCLQLVFSTGLNLDFLVASVFSGTVLFFATIMLVEPMTTPSQSNAKIAFGVIAAALSFAFSFVLPQVSFLAALVVSNLCVSKLDEMFAPKPATSAATT